MNAGEEVAGESTALCSIESLSALNKSDPSKAVPVFTTYNVAGTVVSACCTVADRQPSTGTLDFSGTSLKCSLYRCSEMIAKAEPVSTTSSAGQ